MAMDTPARIAIVGAGPVGLETALYARFLGYDVDLYERGRAAENLLRWGHVRLYSPWAANVSPLGMAAIRAQQPDWRPPADDTLMSGRELAEQYFILLAQSDLLVDGLHERTEVVSIGRPGLLKMDRVASEAREDEMFRLLLRDATGAEQVALADVVIDSTGTYGNHNWLGQGGIPARGETHAAAHIEYGLPDVLGQDRANYVGRRVLLVGAGDSAATNIVNLAALNPRPQLIWATRPDPTLVLGEAATSGPIALVANDPLPERERIAREANALAKSPDGGVAHWPGTEVESVEWLEAENHFRVTLVGKYASTIEVDRIIASVGNRPDRRLYEELQVTECPVSGGPLNLAQALSKPQAAPEPASLINPEPDFYILGAKSYGRDSRFLLSHGRAQVRDLFTILGDRADLDLYANMSRGRR